MDTVSIVATSSLAFALVVVVIVNARRKTDDDDRAEMIGEKTYRTYRDGFQTGLKDGNDRADKRKGQ